MNESDRGSGWYLWSASIAILFAAVVAAVWMFTPLPMIVGIYTGMRQVRRVEARMQLPEIYLPTATNLALYCQSAEDLNLTNNIGASRLPQPLPSLVLHSAWASIDTNRAFVEFGGGFYHYGYVLQLDPIASSGLANVWELYLEREDQPQKLLHRFTLSPAARLSSETFTMNALAEYNRKLAKSPGDIDLHKAKISLLLQYHPTEVRAACLDAIKALPAHWWPRLTLAILETGNRNFEEANGELVKFVQAKPSYSRYIYLAYFYQVIDKPRDAAQAIEKAISCPIVDLDDDENNTECRGYSAGVYAYRSREYATAVKLCNALLPIKENGNYAKAALQDLKSAAESAIAGSNSEFTPSEAVLGFNPYERIDVRALLSK